MRPKNIQFLNWIHALLKLKIFQQIYKVLFVTKINMLNLFGR